MNAMDLRLTVESVLPADAVEAAYRMYVAAFEPVRSRAAARQVLSREEFDAEMVDARIDKYVVWDGASPAGLATLATDVRAVPWIEPEFYVRRYADWASRDALFYLGFTLVDPAQERRGAHDMIMEARSGSHRPL
jgi:hypothetical protein